MKLPAVAAVTLSLAALVVVSCAGGGDVVPEDVTYADVDAIFRSRCLECHSEDEAKGELVLERYTAVLQGGESGPVVVPGNAEESLLVQLIEHREKPHMPMKARRLPRREIAVIRAWINGGARSGG